jgi:hypothetical protein
VTLQITVFSILLLGTTGLVLDSGRVYYTHSQMQAFADQMALAAANELDGQDDAIQRATNAVYGFTGSLPFLNKSGAEVGDFEIEFIAYYSNMAPSDLPQNDMTEAFTQGDELAIATDGSPTYTSGDPVDASNAAQFAVVKISQKTLPSAFARISTSAFNLASVLNEGEVPEKDFNETLDFSAVSAATLERRTCADLSTLVFCNPWEDQGSSPLDVEKDDPEYSVPGRSLMYFAPNFDGAGISEQPISDGTSHGSLYPWNENHQLFRLTDPIADPGGICSLDYLLALATEDASSESSVDYVTARDRCLMARARAETVCWGPGDELSIAPAPGPMVSRAINTAFDIWHEPFNTAISNDVAVGSSGLTRAQFFEPDMLATTAYETADRHGDDPLADPQDGTPDYLPGEGLEVEYDTVPMEGHSFVQSLYGAGINYDTCHAGTYTKYATGSANGAECSADFIGDYFEGDTSGLAPNKARMQFYWQNLYGLNPRSPSGRLPTDISTWYELYKHERDNFATVNTNGNLSRVNRWSSTDGADTQDNVSAYGLADETEKFLKHGPDDFFHRSGSTGLLATGYERRRIRSAMVNCTATVDEGTNDAGTYDVAPEDIRILEVYMPQPPGHFCGPNQLGCELDASVETRMFMEIIEDVTDEAYLHRFTAQLVR